MISVAKFLKSIFLNNLIIKITSFVLAVLTWVYIAGELYKEKAVKEEEASSVIEVSGEKIIVKRLPIYVNIEGAPARGYEVALERVELNPSTSVIAGPAAAIKDLSYILTEPINIKGATGNIRRNVKLMQISGCKVGHSGLVRVVIPIIKTR